MRDELVKGPCSVAPTGSTAQELYSRFRHLSAGTTGTSHHAQKKDYDLLIILIKLQIPAVEKNVGKQMPLHSARSHCYKLVGGVFHKSITCGTTCLQIR